MDMGMRMMLCWQFLSNPSSICLTLYLVSFVTYWPAMHGTSKFTSTITVCNVSLVYLFFVLCYLQNWFYSAPGVALLLWLVNWALVSSSQPRSHLISVELHFFPGIYWTHLAAFNFSPVIDNLRNTYQRMLKVAGPFKLLKPFPLQ